MFYPQLTEHAKHEHEAFHSTEVTRENTCSPQSPVYEIQCMSIVLPTRKSPDVATEMGATKNDQFSGKTI